MRARLIIAPALVAPAVAALALAACGGGDLVLPAEGEPASITVVRGAGQTGPSGAALGDSVVVRVTDTKGRPVAGQMVAFVVVGGGGNAAPDTAATDDEGRAATRWILGAAVGAQRLEARVVASGGGGPLATQVTAQAVAGTAAALVLVGGDGQTGTVGSPLPDSLVVRVDDADGNPVAGVAVSWAVAGGGGAVSAAQTTTGADGRTGVVRTLGTAPGAATTTASVAGLTGSPVTFAATARTGSAGALSITTQPSATAQSGVPFARQPQVQLRDAGGNAVAQAGVAVSATLASGPSGAALSGSTTVATNAQGLATFTNLGLSGPAGAYTIAFGGAGLSGAVSSAVTIQAGAATRLALLTQPSATAQSGVPFAQQPRVQLRDASNNPVRQAGVAVTVTVATGGGALGGTTTRTTDANGVAAFTDLAIVGAGVHTLIFAADGYAGITSNAITVSIPNAAPTAANDGYQTLEDQRLTIGAPGVLGNDSDPDGDRLTAAVVQEPQHGTLTLNADGSFSYLGATDYNGTDSFTYTASDGTHTSAPATVTLTIVPVNDPPVFTKGPDQVVSKDAGPQTVPNWATNIMIGPNNPSHDQTLTFHVSSDHPEWFEVQPAITPDGTLTYDPNGLGTGVVTVTVVLQDSGGTANGGNDTSDPQTFTITIQP
ncbi:MAG TPA: Ig-like domain-containing protein [Gemmatimonadales bacterium]|nr:Ig-like domain-containing protein [Gemmatimonadales bacterium]